MPNETQYLTSEKFTELEKELVFLKKDRRKEVAEHLEYAKKLGDLSENAEYHQAREEQAEVEDRINRLENILKNAVITKTHGSDVATIGSTIKLARDGSNGNLEYIIVGSEEADMSKGKISNLSPLGSVLIGHKKGDVVKVSAPKGTVAYTILDIK